MLFMFVYICMYRLGNSLKYSAFGKLLCGCKKVLYSGTSVHKYNSVLEAVRHPRFS
jgi:hypothetical protein